MDLDFNWQEPWQPLEMDQVAAFEQELQREVMPGHRLYGLEVTAVAQRIDSDDVLFRIRGPVRRRPPHVADEARDQRCVAES